METEIRRAVLADLDELLPLVHGYRAFYEQAHDADEERAFIARMLRDATGAIFLARRAGAAIGFAQLFHAHSTVRLGTSLILEDLFVEPGARGGGVASALLAAACAYAREIGAVGMFLETAADNAVARRVYERAGWQRERVFVKYNAPE